MNEEDDAAVVEDIEPDLVEQADAEVTDEEVDTEDEVEANSEDEEPSDPSPEKKADKFQERIDEVTKKFRETERRALELENDLAEARRIAAETPAEVAPAGKTLADFEYDEAKYASYLTEHAKQAAEAAVQQRAHREQMDSRQREFSAKEADFSVTVDDYNKVTRNDLQYLNPHTLEALQTSDKGPDLLYYLGKNPDVASNLYKMHPLAAAIELGRIEATKLVKPEKSVKTPAAPPPKLKAVDATARIKSDSAESDKLSDDEWLKRERKRLAAKAAKG